MSNGNAQKPVPNQADQRPVPRQAADVEAMVPGGRRPETDGGILLPATLSMIAFVAVGAALFVLSQPENQRTLMARVGLEGTVPPTDEAALTRRITELERSLRDLSSQVSITASIDRTQARPGSATGPASPVLLPPETSQAIITRFGVRLGTVSSFEEARARWRDLPRLGLLLDGLEPRLRIDERDSALVAELVVGPFLDAEQAALFCATLPAASAGCRPIRFEGQALPSGE